MGIERVDSILRSGGRYRFVRKQWGSDRRLAKEGKESFFEASTSRKIQKSGLSREWRNSNGEVLTREVFQEGVQSLDVTVQMRDALATSWYLRIWWIRGEET